MADNRKASPAEGLDGNLPAEVKALLDMGGAQLVSAPVARADGSTVYFLGGDVKAHHLPALNPVLPDHVVATEVFTEPDSFIDYLIRFRSSRAIVRAMQADNRFVAVLDYHGDARGAENDAAVPGRCSHMAQLKCPWDPDYAKWRAVFDESITQDALLEFIEDVIHTIGEPLAGDLIDAISNVELDREAKFKSVRNLRNGTVQFTYAEEERPGTVVVTMPEVIRVVTPIYQGGGTLMLDVKLRYALHNGRLVFKLALPGREKLERDGFRTIGAAVLEKTAVPVFYVA